MPQATDELRTRWGGEQGVGEDRAFSHLMAKGFKIKAGLIQAPAGYDHRVDTEDTEGAVDFLCDEWDYAYVPTTAVLG